MIVTVAFLLAALPDNALCATIPPPPLFPPSQTVDTLHGVRIADPYRALEDGSDPKVQQWSDAQNKHARAYLDALPAREVIGKRLRLLNRGTAPAYSHLRAAGEYVFALFANPDKQQPELVRFNADTELSSRQTVLDPAFIDAAGHTTIDWFVPSPDGLRIAVSLSRNGSEDGTLHVYDVSTRREIDSSIPRVQYPTAGGAVAWMPDSESFLYTRYPDESAPASEQHFNQTVFLHRIATPLTSDRQVLSGKDGLPRTAEISLDDRGGGGAVLASVELGDGGQWMHFVLRPNQPALRVADYEDHVVVGAIGRDGTVFGVSRRGAPKGKVLKLAPPYGGEFASAATIVREDKAAAIIDPGPFGLPPTLAVDRLFVTRSVGGPSEVDIYNLSGGHLADLPVPPNASVGEIVALPSGDILYSVSTYTEPTYIARWSRNTGTVRRTQPVAESTVSFADTTVTRIFATSKDGTKVPVNIIARKGTPLDGRNPLVLYGYGGYGVSMRPRFLDAMWRLWLDAGGVYAVANIRGGGEYGDTWHRQGMLTHKQHVFEDFAAVAGTLIKLGYTSHDRLALLGVSNGGLLMGAMITQHPSLARAVISSVGTYDMIREELDPNGAFNVSEYGTVADPREFAALRAYSPYHHVRAGTAYPAVLLLTGANDGRVNPWHSRKFAAALQASQAANRPVLLCTSKSSGHGIGSSLDDRIREQTDELVFFFDQLQVDSQSLPHAVSRGR